MTLKVNESVINGFKTFPLEGYYFASIPKFAKESCLSDAENAPWTNRVPEHEPWPRTMKVNTNHINTETDEYKRNTHHNDQFSDTGGKDSKDIGVVEGDYINERNDLWRR
jgi:hypothetical protein